MLTERKVKSREELIKFFKENGYNCLSTCWRAPDRGHTFNDSMLKYCGKTLLLPEVGDRYDRMYHIPDNHYFLEDWLEPLEPKYHSREWWKARLPLINAFIEGAVIENKGELTDWKELCRPSFNCNPDQYRIKPKFKYYEVTLEGWSDKTLEEDNKLLWVESPDISTVIEFLFHKRIHYTNIKEIDSVEEDSLDYKLTR